MWVVDASVAVKWLLEEPGTAEAEALLAGGEPPWAPELLLAEIGNVIWKRTRRSEAPTALRAGYDLLPGSFRHLVPMAELASESFDLALRHDHPISDCFYVALARRESAPLVTADARLSLRFAAAAEIRLLGS